MATIKKITLAQFAQRACAVYAYVKTGGYKGHNNTVYSYGQLGLPMSSTNIVPKAPFSIMKAPLANEKSRDYQVRYKPLSEYKFGGATKFNLGSQIIVPNGVFGFDCTGFLQYLIYGPFQTDGGWETFNPPDTYDYLNGYNLTQALKEGEDRLCIDPTQYEESQCMSKQIGYTNSNNLVSWDDRERFNEWAHREGYVALHWYDGNVDHCGIVVNASTFHHYFPDCKYMTGTFLLDCCYNWLTPQTGTNDFGWSDGVCVKLLADAPRSADLGNRRNCCVIDSYGFMAFNGAYFYDLSITYNRNGSKCISCYGLWYDWISGVALLYSDEAHTQPLTGDTEHIYYAQDLGYNDDIGCILTYSTTLSKWSNPRSKYEPYNPINHGIEKYPWAYFGNWSRHILDAAVKQLQTPVIVSFNSATKVLTWVPNGDETHCEGYKVTIKHGSWEISLPIIRYATTSSATISDYTLGDGLSIKAVVTDAYKSTWKDSEEISVTIAPLAVPQGLRYQWTNDTMYWNSVPSAQTYRVRIGEDYVGDELTSPSLEGLSSYTTGEMAGKVITVEAHCLTRAYSTSAAYTIPPAPSVDTEINSTEIPIITLYSSEEDTFDTMGICSLSDAASINVVNERNGDYYLEMLYPLGTEKSSLIQNHCIITVKPNPYDDYEPFRIYSIEKNSEREIKIKAYHISYDLNGWIMRPNAERSDATIKLSYDDLLARLNNSVEGAIVQPTSHSGAASKYKFNFVSTFEQSARETSPLNGSFTLSVPDNVRSIIVGSEKSMLSGFKGEFKFVRWTVYHQPETQEADATAKCSIRYRKNIKAITAKYSADCAYSAIFPYGVKSSGNSTQSSTVVWMTKDPPVVPIQEGATLASLDFSKVLCLDVSDELIPGISTNDTIGTIDNPTDVMFERVCRKYISENNLNNLQGGLATEIEIDLANLNLRNTEFAEYANLERLRLSEWVKVVYPGIDLAVTMRVEKVEYDALTDRYTSVTLKMVSDNSTPTSVLSSPSQTKALSGTDVINIVKAMGLENEVVTAYYVNNSFYRVYDGTPSEPVTGKADAIYVDKLTNSAYYFFGDQGFIPIAYAAAESKLVMGYYYNGAFYSDSSHTTAITPSATKIYLDYHTNTVYRYDTTLTPSIYVQIGTGIVFGYYHNSQFYKELAHTTLITPTANTVYIDITSGANGIYRYDTTLATPAYIQIGGGGSVYGYYKPSDKKFYRNYNGTTYSGEITGAVNTTYVDKTTPSHGIFMYESETGFTAITYNEVAKSPYYDSSETAHKAGTKGMLPAAPANQYGYILSTSPKGDEGTAPTNQNNVLWASPSSLGLLEHKPYYSAEANYSGMMKYWKITLDPETEEPSYSWQYITAPSAAEVAQGELYLSWNSGTPKWKTATGGSMPTPTAENKVLMSNAQLSWVETDPSALPGLLPLTAGSTKPITGPLYLCRETPTDGSRVVLTKICPTSAPVESSVLNIHLEAEYYSASVRRYMLAKAHSTGQSDSEPVFACVEVANSDANVQLFLGGKQGNNPGATNVNIISNSGGMLQATGLYSEWQIYSKSVKFCGPGVWGSSEVQEIFPNYDTKAQLGKTDKRFNKLYLSEFVNVNRITGYGVTPTYYPVAIAQNNGNECFCLSAYYDSSTANRYWKITADNHDILSYVYDTDDAQSNPNGSLTVTASIAFNNLAPSVPGTSAIGSSVFGWGSAYVNNIYTKIGTDTDRSNLSTYLGAVRTKLPDPVYTSGNYTDKALTVHKDETTDVLTYSWVASALPTPDSADQIIVSQETSEGSEQYHWVTAVKSTLGFLPRTVGSAMSLLGDLYFNDNYGIRLGHNSGIVIKGPADNETNNVSATILTLGHPINTTSWGYIGDATFLLKYYKSIRSGSSYTLHQLALSYNRYHNMSNVEVMRLDADEMGYSSFSFNNMQYFTINTIGGSSYCTLEFTNFRVGKNGWNVNINPVGNCIVGKSTAPFADAYVTNIYTKVGPDTNFTGLGSFLNTVRTKLPDPGVLSSGESKWLRVHNDGSATIGYSWESFPGISGATAPLYISNDTVALYFERGLTTESYSGYSYLELNVTDDFNFNSDGELYITSKFLKNNGWSNKSIPITTSSGSGSTTAYGWSYIEAPVDPPSRMYLSYYGGTFSWQVVEGGSYQPGAAISIDGITISVAFDTTYFAVTSDQKLTIIPNTFMPYITSTSLENGDAVIWDSANEVWTYGSPSYASGAGYAVTAGTADALASNYIGNGLFVDEDDNKLTVDLFVVQSKLTTTNPLAMNCVNGLATALAEKEDVIDTDHHINSAYVDVGSTTVDSALNLKITAPSDASTNDYLKYNGESWVASALPDFPITSRLDSEATDVALSALAGKLLAVGLENKIEAPDDADLGDFLIFSRESETWSAMEFPYDNATLGFNASHNLYVKTEGNSDIATKDWVRSNAVMSGASIQALRVDAFTAVSLTLEPDGLNIDLAAKLTELEDRIEALEG